MQAQGKQGDASVFSCVLTAFGLRARTGRRLCLKEKIFSSVDQQKSDSQFHSITSSNGKIYCLPRASNYYISIILQRELKNFRIN